MKLNNGDSRGRVGDIGAKGVVKFRSLIKKGRKKRKVFDKSSTQRQFSNFVNHEILKYF